MLTLGKVQRTAVGLEDATICFIRVNALNVVKEDSVKVPLIIVRLDEVQLKVCQ